MSLAVVDLKRPNMKHYEDSGCGYFLQEADEQL